MKYARLEAERRFLLDALPDLAGARLLHITDRYLHGTRLRLRVVREGEGVVRKLGQKVPRSTSTNEHTTLYLDDTEHALLQTLPADELVKTRYVLDGWGLRRAPDRPAPRRDRGSRRAVVPLRARGDRRPGLHGRGAGPRCSLSSRATTSAACSGIQWLTPSSTSKR